MNKLKLFSGILLTVTLLACKKNINEASTPDYNNADQTHELDVPAGFEWHTAETIAISIEPEQKGMMLIIDDRGTVYNRAYLKADKEFTVNVSVPTYAEKLFLYFRGAEEEISLHASNHTSRLK